LTRFIDGDIAGRLARDEITPTQARALNELSRFTGSAIRAAANPNDPMTAFAQEYLGQLLGPGGAGTTGGSGTPAVDPETQQQMASIRLAIDEGQPEAAAESFNNIVERRATADPTASRTDIANQLMQELRIQPGSAGLALTANGSVRPVSSAEYGDAVSLIADAYQRGDRTLSREQAEQQANVYLNRHGVPIRYPEVIEPTVVVTASRIKPFTTGSEIADQIIGGLHGAGLSMVGFFKGIFHTVVDVGRIPFDGWLAIVDLALPETMFADSNQRNAARVDTVNNIIANIDQLPEQVTAYFNGRLARANELEASGDHIGAARERAEMAGDVVLMLENPKSPGAVKILERLGIDPVLFERTTQSQKAFRDAMIAEELKLNPRFSATGYEAHHSFPIKDFPELDGLRARLKEWGININGVENGVMLPGYNAPAGSVGTYHGSLRDPGYGDAIALRFRDVTDAAGARAALTKINDELRNGTFQFTRQGK
jgi:hypothetical protein